MVSLVQFAREFEKLKSDLSVSPTDGLKLLRMIEFWSRHGTELKSPSFHTYFDDFLVVCEMVSEGSLQDLSVDEFVALKDALGAIVESSTNTRVRSLAEQKLKMVLFCLIKTLCYVGDLETALPLATELSGSQEVPRFEEAISAQSDAFEALTRVISLLERENPSVNEVLTEVRDRWEAERECISDDRAFCVLVENDPTTGRGRGILGTLHGTIEERGPKIGDDSVIDTVTFGNQLRAQDDPLAKVLYNSLEAVRGLPRRFALADNAKDGLHAYFSVPGSSGVFTGGSVGFAAGVLTYSQLLKPIIQRERKFVPASVAFTGTLDSAGAIGSVNSSTLRDKVRRAFFSHLELLAIPETNLPEAKTHLKRLSEALPRRRLRLTGFESLSDALGSHDIMRSEKVCLGEFAARKAIKYSRATKVQIPLLLSFIYVLTCLVYPPVWIFFDWNPKYVRLTETGFIALNADSYSVWSVELGCNSLGSHSQSIVADLNDDGKNEILYIPKSAETDTCECNLDLLAYNDEGELQFRNECIIHDEYPGDSIVTQHYGLRPIEIFEANGRKIIKTQIYRSSEARTHFRLWSATGDSVGWYIDQGHMGAYDATFLVDSRSRMVCLGYNNQTDCVSLLVLDPESTYGVAPPYTLPFHRPFTEGTQLHYILLKPTDLNRITGSLYNFPHTLTKEPGCRAVAEVREMDEVSASAFIRYHFDNEFRIDTAIVNDRFWNARKKFARVNALPAISKSEYERNLCDSVTYWIDSRWVTEAELDALKNSPR